MGGSYADLILVGASLSNCLLAWFIKRRHPHCRILIFERSAAIPARRTWSFHRSDVGENFEIIRELVAKQWDGYDIYLPRICRSFDSAYCSIRPDRLQEKIEELVGDDLIFSSPVEDVNPQFVKLADGNLFHAGCVLDSRNDFGWRGRAGYQKFVGLHVRLDKPHELHRPILMDASVAQEDGYRFFYVLPWSNDELLIEDTRYSAKADLDLDLFRTEIENYAQSRDWNVRSVEQCETGVLPIPLNARGFNKANENAVGVAGGFFHPVTGYSLPLAVALADRISRLERLSLAEILTAIQTFRRERAVTVKFMCILNRMMFTAAEPQDRFRIFEHFYSLPESTIQRFYAGNIQFYDSMRLLCGRPPVKISAALRSLASEGVAL